MYYMNTTKGWEKRTACSKLACKCFPGCCWMSLTSRLWKKGWYVTFSSNSRTHFPIMIFKSNIIVDWSVTSTLNDCIIYNSNISPSEAAFAFHLISTSFWFTSSVRSPGTPSIKSLYLWRLELPRLLDQSIELPQLVDESIRRSKDNLSQLFW